MRGGCRQDAQVTGLSLSKIPVAFLLLQSFDSNLQVNGRRLSATLMRIGCLSLPAPRGGSGGEYAMSLENRWNHSQRVRLVAQLKNSSQAFAGRLPDTEAVDGLIMNLQICIALGLAPADMFELFGPRVWYFLTSMLAASQSETVEPELAFNLAETALCQKRFAVTRFGVIGADGRMLADEQTTGGNPDGTVHLVFRSRKGTSRN
jgi:hypothetical protein